MTLRLLTVLFFASPALLLAGDWPQWRGPSFDGVSQEIVPAEFPEPLPVLWKTNVHTGFSTVSVEGDRVLTMGNRDNVDTVWCLSASSGEALWKHSYPCDADPRFYEGGPSATPTIHEGSVYTLSRKGQVFRLDLETGEVIWSRDLVTEEGVELPEWSFASSPVIDGDRVLLNVGRGGIALSRQTGETLWLPSTETSGYASLVPYARSNSEVTHMLFSAEALIGLNSETGKASWEFPWKSSRDVNAADPVLYGERVLISSSSGSVMLGIGPDGTTPHEVWKQPDMRWYFNPGVLIGEHIYSIHGTTHRPTELICVEAETGKIVWTESGFGSGALMAAGNTGILFDEGTLTLFEASPEGFQPLLEQQVLEGKCWTVPVLANGRIYCRNAAGDLACLSLNGR